MGKRKGEGKTGDGALGLVGLVCGIAHIVVAIDFSVADPAVADERHHFTDLAGVGEISLIVGKFSGLPGKAHGVFLIRR